MAVAPVKLRRRKTTRKGDKETVKPRSRQCYLFETRQEILIPEHSTRFPEDLWLLVGTLRGVPGAVLLPEPQYVPADYRAVGRESESRAIKHHSYGHRQVKAVVGHRPGWTGSSRLISAN